MQLYTDSLHRIAYSTDASAYREMPVGVVYPRSEEDIRSALEMARARHTCLIPRAGGTSIAGQVVGSGIVLDVSRYLNHILEIDAEARTVRVEPGVVRDELNLALRPYGLFFSPETSTSNRCCIGGMIGNNSCGTHSLVYGSTRHHVLALRVMLADGSVHTLRASGKHDLSESPLFDGVLAQLSLWQRDEALMQRIAEAYPDPSLRRRSCGYALDECLAVEGLDLCALLTGSEGTLCVVLEATLSLDPLPPCEQMVVCAHLDELDKSWPANLIALRHHPTAVELLDGRILDLCRDNRAAQANRFFVSGDPASIVIAEFRADTRAELDAMATAFEADVASLAYTSTRVYGADVSRVWALRKAGLGVLSSVEGDAKPIGVIEDTAVAPHRMAAYMHDFEAMMTSLDLSCVYYGHISTGELHLRPILDIKQPRDRALFRTVAEQTAVLVKRHHGSLSGEHGDGRLRGEFIPLMYGEEAYGLMCRIKELFDPDHLLNMGKIVHTPPMDQSLRYDLHQRYAGVGDKDLMRRIERCNGAGDCRKSTLIGGTLCPAFKATGDELRTTRARANVLREMLTRHADALTSPEVEEVLSSCLACKGCLSECPSAVDMTRLRSEVLQLRYARSHTPFRVWMVAHMALIERIGSLVPGIYNYFARAPWSSAILKRLMHFATERQIPTLSRHTLRQIVHRTNRTSIVHRTSVHRTSKKVFLFADEFTNYQEAELGLRFADLMRRMGYEVIVPRHVESGRAAISKGCLTQASRYALRNVELLADIVSADTPLVGIEPSCILSFRDEYPRLVPEALRARAKTLAANCLLYDEWLCREVEQGRLRASDFSPLDADVWLHGHCHQKALVGVDKTARVLSLIPGARVHVIPSGCCGMAGSYGYEQAHYADSMRIGETVLFPAVRAQGDEVAAGRAIVCAPGTSCRQQILDGTGIPALHPIEVIANHYHSL